MRKNSRVMKGTPSCVCGEPLDVHTPTEQCIETYQEIYKADTSCKEE